MNKFKQNTTMSSKLFEGTKTAKAIELIAHSAATGSQEDKAIRIGGKEVIHGMEHLINPDVTHFIVLKRRCHIHSVLEEQEAQTSAGIRDPSRIAQVSEATSSFSREWASRIWHLQHAPLASLPRAA